MSARKTVRKLAAEELFEYAVKYLAMRACSAGELRQKLLLKAAARGDIDGVLIRLKEIGYLDDAKFAESYANLRADGQGFGRMRVLSDLRARRVPPKIAESAIAQVYEGKDEAELIDAYIDRRLPNLQDDEKHIAAAYRKLRRAGFSSGKVLAALKRRVKNTEVPDELAGELPGETEA